MRNITILCSLLLVFCLPACGKKKADEKSPATTEKEPTAPKSDEPVIDKEAQADHADHEHAHEEGGEAAEGTMAEAVVKAASGSKVEGVVHFMAKGESLTVHAKLSGLTPGDHGFHVHETGDCSAPDAKSAGGHFNPGHVDHGAPTDEAHHGGDLGNIKADDSGVAEVTMTIGSLSLDPKADNSVIGKAVIVHGGADDLKSQPSGAAGPRVACGVVELK